MHVEPSSCPLARSNSLAQCAPGLQMETSTLGCDGSPSTRATTRPSAQAAADGDRRGRSRVLLDILDVQEILCKFFLGDQVRRLPIVLSELPDRPNIGFLSSLREASELQTLDHSLSQFGHNYTSGLEYS